MTSFSGTSKDINCSTTYQQIGEFYSGKSVFMTGGTGFLGKVFLEKLLYSCNKLDKVYVLAREKKNENVSKRIENIFANPGLVQSPEYQASQTDKFSKTKDNYNQKAFKEVRQIGVVNVLGSIPTLFSRLKKSNPDFMKKVVPITGDLTLPNLGMSSKDEQTLIDKVSVVYHAAATVKFTEPLHVAMSINFEGTQKILELSRRMKNIEVFVHISTAFTQTQHKILVETVYPPPAKVEDIYKFIED